MRTLPASGAWKRMCVFFDSGTCSLFATRLSHHHIQDEDSISEEEDEIAEAITENLELNFFKTLAKIKADDPAIYDKSKKFFDEEASEDESQPGADKKKKKPMFLKDYERQQLLTKGAKAFVSEDEDGACATPTSF